MLQRIGVAYREWKFRIDEDHKPVTLDEDHKPVTAALSFLIFWNALFWDLLIQNIALGRIFKRDIGEDFGNFTSLLLSLVLISFGFATIRPGSLAYIILIVFKFINNADCGYNLSRSYVRKCSTKQSKRHDRWPRETEPPSLARVARSQKRNALTFGHASSAPSQILSAAK